MFSIEVKKDRSGIEIELKLDGEHVESYLLEGNPAPVKVAMKVRQLTEDYMGIGE